MDVDDEGNTGSRRRIAAQQLKEKKALELAQKSELSKCNSKVEKKVLIQQHKAQMERLQKCHALNLPTAYVNEEPHEGSEVKEESATQPSFYSERETSKVQKKKAKKRQACEQKLIQLDHLRIQNSQTLEEEKAIITKFLKDRHLYIYNIPSDGHCLFRALEHQLHYINYPQHYSYKDLRELAARYMLEHRLDFEIFWDQGYTNEDPFKTSSSFDEHCYDIHHTAAWGGELEITAIVKALNVSLEVYLAQTPSILYYSSTQNFSEKQLQNKDSSNNLVLRLSFHVSLYSSGPHYNSVLPIPLNN